MSNKAKAATQERNPELKPKLRFAKFRDSGDWELFFGYEIFEQINDRSPDPNLPVLAITQEHGAIPRNAIDYHVSVTEKSIENYKVVQVGDFIISLRSFQGGIEYSQYHGKCSPAYVILRRRLEGSDVYFKSYLKTDRFIRLLTRNLEGLRDGKMVSYSQFSELSLPVPSPVEQQKIADCLSSVDELIAAQARKLDALENHKKRLVQQLFLREGETQPRLRFPEFQDAGEWKKHKVSNVLKRVANPVKVDLNQLYRQIGIRSHGKGIFHKEPVNGKELGDKRVFWVEQDTFIVNIVFAWEQAVANTSAEESGMIASHRFPMYRPRGNKSDVKYIKHFFLTKKGKELLGLASPGGAGRNKTLGQKEFDNLDVFLPEQLEEQAKIADFLTSIDHLIVAQTEKLDALKSHRKGLVQQLFPSTEGNRDER
jgi:type I restriction enzyme S subunit